MWDSSWNFGPDLWFIYSAYLLRYAFAMMHYSNDSLHNNFVISQLGFILYHCAVPFCASGRHCLYILLPWPSPWYNHNGWLGVKHQVTYLLPWHIFSVWAFFCHLTPTSCKTCQWSRDDCVRHAHNGCVVFIMAQTSCCALAMKVTTDLKVKDKVGASAARFQQVTLRKGCDVVCMFFVDQLCSCMVLT